MSAIGPTPATGGTPPKSTRGMLAAALIGLLTGVHTVTLVGTTVIAISVAATVLPALALPLGERLGYPAALLILIGLGWAIFVLTVAVTAILPPLLLSERDRSVFAAHSWIGAREVRRVLGNAARASGLPRDARSAEAWLARNPADDRTRTLRVEVLLLAGRFDEARLEAELLPERTPLETYRKRAARAIIEDHAGGTVDEGALQSSVDAIPGGIDRTEAMLSLAAFRARRALPDGDWRVPLLEARPAIPGSNIQVLVADFGLPLFEFLFRKIVVPITALFIIIGLSLTVLRP